MKKVSRYGYSDIGGRTVNEDAYGSYVYGKNIVIVIADGLGGQGDGQAASALAVESLSKCGCEGNFPNEEELALAFREANRAVIKKQSNKFHMKTTAVYLCIHGERAIWGHIGDSRLYHFFNGKLCDYTLDHSLSQVAVALGEIERKDIPCHAQRSRLLRALGCEGEEAKVHEPVTLESGKHAFLLCTDGFWEHLSDEEISEVLKESESAKMWILNLQERMKGRCNSNRDNHTAEAVILEV